MNQLFRLTGAVAHSVAVEEWLAGTPSVLYDQAREWFTVMRQCGTDVTELIHDGCPVACIKDAAFAYVNVFKQHINVGFYVGAYLDDPNHLLEGAGKRMRHVKLKPDTDIDREALTELIHQAYTVVKAEL